MLGRSDELRKLIIHRSEAYGIPLQHVYGDEKSFKRFCKAYFNTMNLSKTADYSNKVLDMAKKLGINPRIVLVVDSKMDMNKAKEELERAYEEKRAIAKAKKDYKRNGITLS
jgi:hypothetical protein